MGSRAEPKGVELWNFLAMILDCMCHGECLHVCLNGVYVLADVFGLMHRDML